MKTTIELQKELIKELETKIKLLEGMNKMYEDFFAKYKIVNKLQEEKNGKKI